MFQRVQNVVLISKGSSFLATVDTVVKHVALRCMSVDFTRLRTQFLLMMFVD